LDRNFAGAGFAIKRTVLNGQKDILLENVPLISVRRYPLLPLVAAGSLR
jgi:hypothetical protein